MHRMTDIEALKACQTLTPSIMTLEEAINRLQTINVLVYAHLGVDGSADQYDRRVADHGDGDSWYSKRSAEGTNG